MHAWINITHPGFSGRQDMPDDGDQWVSWEQMVATMRAKGEAEGRAAMLAREVVELRGEVAKLKQVPAVVVPEPTSDEWRAIAENAGRADMVDFLAGAAAYGLWLREHSRAIPSDRVLGEGEARIGMNELRMLRDFAGRRMSEREHDRLEAVRDAHEDALRANQGGLNHVHV